MNITINGLEKTIKKNTVLSNINLNLTGNKIYGIQGKNGCGKTMLLRCIAGLILPTKGEIIINGKTLHKDISIPKSIGVLIENPSFLPHYSGKQNLSLLSGLWKQEADVDELIETVGLGQNADKKFSSYSLGMKQRLGIAAAIMGNPEIILLDEPINAIDGEGVEQIRQVILNLKDNNRIIVIACHDKEEMELLADEIIPMSEGKIVTGV